MSPPGPIFVVDGPTSAEDWWVLMAEVRQRWPESFFHRVDEGEMLIYRDQRAFQAGVSSDEVPSDAIRVLMGPERLTLTLNPHSAPMGEELFTVLQNHRGVKEAR